MVIIECYLGDMLSAAGGCELSTTTPGRVQGAATSSLFMPPLFQDAGLGGSVGCAV